VETNQLIPAQSQALQVSRQTLDEWLAWLEHRNPNHIELGLDRVRGVWQAVRQSHGLVLPTIVTVAGTNGKGSSVAMLEAILMAEGYRVGAYTSPHLERFNERIRIQGLDIEDEPLVRAMILLDAEPSARSLTYFEWATLCAFIVFAHAKLDVWVLEVGLGGRLDAVNILDANLALITNIGLDHQALLGADRASIAREKAGILRTNQAAVYADPNPEPTIEAIASALNCPVWIRGKDFSLTQQVPNWCLDLASSQSCWPHPTLKGSMQIDNAAGVVALLQHPKNTRPVSRQAIEQGLQSAKVIGRYERFVHQGRLIILDVAHNLESVEALLENIKLNNALNDSSQRFAVFGALNDKPISRMLSAAQPAFNGWFVGYLPSERSANVASILAHLPEQDCLGLRHETKIVSAYNQALAHSKAGDQIVVFGSFFTVSAIRHHLKQVGAHLV
jgi:dihydrofolate synthase/folylpolyglutamate synthase